MALFFFLVDYKNYGKYLDWLKIYGMNSILAYMLYEIIDFSGVVNSVFRGVEQYIGGYYEVVLKLGSVSIIFFILWLLYRKRIFLKV